MRELKFRVWDCNTKELHTGNVCDIHWLICGQPIACRVDVSEIEHKWLRNGFNADIDEKDVHFVLQQYTGLKDKNEKEIYEGDIFSFGFGSKGSIVQVIFKDGYFAIEHKSGSTYLLASELDLLTLIGNIYETPELCPK